MSPRPPEEYSRMELRDYVAVLRKYWISIVCVTLILSLIHI